MTIVPAETPLTAPYWAAAREGAIAVQRCSCGHVWHPPAPVCPRCRRTDYAWFRASGTGRLHSYTRVEHAAHPAIADAVPYLVALVDLDEGPRVIVGLLEGDVEPGPGAEVRIGLATAAGGLRLPMARLLPRGAAGAAGPARPA